MVTIYEQKLTNLQQEIVRLLFVKAGNSLNAHTISVLLEVSQPAVSKALPLLEKEKLITVKRDIDSGRLSIRLHTENHYTIWLKRADNIKQLYESGLVQKLYDSFQTAAIILFGSYSFGEDVSGSDIDFAIVGSKEKKIDMSSFEKQLERIISFHYFKEFASIPRQLLCNICNGITLKGAISV